MDGLYPYCAECSNAACRASSQKLRLEVILHLGDQCQECGYDADRRAFVVDHVNGDGADARRAGVGGSGLLHAALADTEGKFQLLCWNCNSIKRVANEECGVRGAKRRTPPREAPDKRCPGCTTVKPAAEFYISVNARDGLTSYCASCTSSRNKASYRALRLRAVEHHGGGCKHCGYCADDRALAFDHVDGGGSAERKSSTSHRRRALLQEAIRDENGKFQLLCANCNHLKRLDNAEGAGNRKSTRTVVTVRTFRPDGRLDPELLAVRAERMRERMRKINESPELRAKEFARRSAAMKASWALRRRQLPEAG